MKLSELELNSTVEINGHEYTFKGFKRRLSQYVFEATIKGEKHLKTFNFNSKVEIKEINGKLIIK